MARTVASKPDRNASIDNVSSSISDVEKSTLHSGTPPNDDIEKLIIDPLNPQVSKKPISLDEVPSTHRSINM